MKTKFISLVIFVSLAVAAQAQLYINAQVGYAVPSSVAAFDHNDVTITPTSYSEELVVGTSGGGILPALTVGYMFNENFGVELTGAYLMGSTTSATEDIANDLFTINTLIERSTAQIRVSPTFVVKGNGESVTPYAKFGALLPVAGQTTTQRTIMVGSSETYVKAETQGKISVGFQGSLGGEVELSDNISLFGELAFQSLSIQGKSSEIVEYTENGVDAIGELLPAERMVNYIDVLTNNSNNFDVNDNANPLEASEDLRPVSAYGNVGINLGISLKLN